MNLHPLIVHFPVALLTVYCGLEVFSQFWQKQNSHILFAKRGLLWLGTLGVFVALATGDAAQAIYGRSYIIELHENIADIVNIIFIVISAIYLLGASDIPLMSKFLSPKILENMTKLTRILQAWKITLILAIIGFLFLGSLGAVGGAISRGKDSDPISKFIIEKFGNEAVYNARGTTRDTQKSAE